MSNERVTAPATGRRGNLVIVAAPSGGGKSSLVNALLERDPGLVLSISHTTRQPRPGENDGDWYHFTDRESFLRLVDEGAFLEHATVFDNHYGTHAGEVERQLEQGLDVILEIDWQGARQVRAARPETRSIFIVPPSLEVLRQRLSRRATDSDSTIERRMRDAQSEISHWHEFDFVVVNDDFDTALADLEAVFRSLRLAVAYQEKQHDSLLAELLANR
ncbi:MAG: guanylate kinase [Xanthomonadales bacterium]|nr:guanylate kinase [Xanthomonadales bacterium]NIX11614.1 guanylate kinase [Xanthomonadales bacterium]